MDKIVVCCDRNRLTTKYYNSYTDSSYSNIFFGDEAKKFLDEDELEDAFKGAPSFDINVGDKVIDMLINAKICSSKREAREFISAGSICINGEKVSDEGDVITSDKLLYNKYLIVRKGKKKYYIGK